MWQVSVEFRSVSFEGSWRKKKDVTGVKPKAARQLRREAKNTDVPSLPVIIVLRKYVKQQQQQHPNCWHAALISTAGSDLRTTE